MKRVLITGGHGLIGSALRIALARDYDVDVFDDYHREPDTWRGAGSEWGRRDVRDEEAITEAVATADIVVHAAAIAGVGTVVEHPYRVLDVNMIGTHRVLEAMRQHRRPQQLVYFSTSEVYGPYAYRAKETDQTVQGPPTAPRWVYATSKLAGEHLCLAYGREYGIAVTVVRPFNVYGPGQRGEGAIRNFVAAARANEPLIVHGNGEQIRSWCSVHDCTEAVCQMIRHPHAGEIFNVGNPYETTSTLQLAHMVLEATSSTSPVVFKPLSYPEVEVRVPDISKAQRAFEWVPYVSLRDGLADMARSA